METVGIDLGVPHFSIVTELGKGGFGSVHLGFDHNLDRWLAIKVLESVDGIELQEAFEAEAKSHSRLSRHDNVVTVHQAGFTPLENRPWIAMEYAEGGTLQDYLNDHPDGIPWDHAVAWLVPICDAVQAAHDQGILHRDIKPENILLETSGKPLLSDFGIACLTDDTEQTPVASMAHAAPEMFQGLPRTEQSDVFSLGTTLYLLLTGYPPFGWTPVDRIQRLDTVPPALPEHLDAPAWVDRVLMACLAADPADRPGSAEELQASLAAGLGSRRVDLPTIPHAVLTPPAEPDRPVDSGGASTVLVRHPGELPALDAAAPWAPTQLARESSPEQAPSRPRATTWRRPILAIAAVVGVIAGAGGYAFVVDRAAPGNELSPASTTTAGPAAGATVGDDGGDPGSPSSTSFLDGAELLSDLSVDDRLALANLQALSSIPSSAPIEDATTGPVDVAELTGSAIGSLPVDLRDHGFTAGNRRAFSYLDHEMESLLLLFEDEAGAAAYLEDVLANAETVPHQPGAPRNDDLELVRSDSETIMALSQLGLVVSALAVATPGAEIDPALELHTVVSYGTLLRERLSDVTGGHAPVAAWLAVKTTTGPFDDPAVVEALEAAMNDELALEVLGGRIAIAAFDGIASVDLELLRENMVPDQNYRPEAANALLELAPITTSDRWWCDEASVADSESWGCYIFTETGQQRGGEEGLQLFEILAQEGAFLSPHGLGPTDAAVLVAEFIRDIGVAIDVAVTTLPDQSFGSRVLNGYHEALLLPAS